ncbi:MAG: PD-(D/E)XK nuclease family protein [Ruminococcus sp.]|nr:PD-(D/E)XK nuclease family protein [Ruminococcus sp.]
MNEIEKNAIKEFLFDINCLRKLDKWADDFNLFDVLKITKMEIRHSNILAWLFDPNESHALGDAFIKEFVRILSEKIDDDKTDCISLMLQDFYSYQVYREANHMDIVLFSREEKTAIIIENKICSGESKHQLTDYYEKSLYEFKDCTEILYVFLTPYGIDSSNPERWISYSYEEIIEALECAVEDKLLRSEVSLLIKNYIETVRKNIMRERDEELIRICNDIYNKHRTALRLIFDNANIDNSAESEIICSALQELSNKGLIIYEGNNKRFFATQTMDKFLPPLNSPDSSWGTNYIYWYWFEKIDDRLIIHFELGGDNLNEEQLQHSNLLIKAAGKKERKGYRYYRIFYKSEKISENNFDESLSKAVVRLVNAALENERKLLEKAAELQND